MLRAWFDSIGSQEAGKSRELIERILETGLEPVEPPEPLPPISADDVEVVCWLAIEKEG